MFRGPFFPDTVYVLFQDSANRGFGELGLNRVGLSRRTAAVPHFDRILLHYCHGQHLENTQY